MRENIRKSPYMDYRNSVPFVDLSGFVVRQPKVTEDIPVKSLKECLMKKKFSTMINLRRLEYCIRSSNYRNNNENM